HSAFIMTMKQRMTNGGLVGVADTRGSYAGGVGGEKAEISGATRPSPHNSNTPPRRNAKKRPVGGNRVIFRLFNNAFDGFDASA
ncbi:hypothetical protein, partial [Acidiphilium sp.]|uniref:hypothetical protein n=1 Tax=Acidiphilium sp. TaxID=527 RepID=UPI00258D9C7B